MGRNNLKICVFFISILRQLFINVIYYLGNESTRFYIMFLSITGILVQDENCVRAFPHQQRHRYQWQEH